MSDDLHQCCAILEVAPDAAAGEIRAAYLDLVRVWHPDRFLEESQRLRRKAEEKLKAINLAYERLRSGWPAGMEAAAAPRPAERAPADGIAPVSFGGVWGYANGDGKVVIPPRFQSALAFSEGLAAVLESRRHGFIDARGEWAIYPEFAAARSFSEGLAAVVLSVRWGYIDREGRFRITPLFEECGDFSEGLAAVRWRGRWGYIDTSGAFRIRPRFDGARGFRDGWAEALHGARWGRLNREGELYIDGRPALILPAPP